MVCELFHLLFCYVTHRYSKCNHLIFKHSVVKQKACGSVLKKKEFIRLQLSNFTVISYRVRHPKFPLICDALSCSELIRILYIYIRFFKVVSVFRDIYIYISLKTDTTLKNLIYIYKIRISSEQLRASQIKGNFGCLTRYEMTVKFESCSRMNSFFFSTDPHAFCLTTLCLKIK